jgi:hypothetical protein
MLTRSSYCSNCATITWESNKWPGMKFVAHSDHNLSSFHIDNCVAHIDSVAVKTYCLI